MTDFNKIKIIKKIGSGVFGTTYLVNYKNKKYALKIQHILEEDKIKNFKNEIWREMDLYQFINKLNKNDQLFFTKLYDYQIYDNCKHIQKREFEIDDDLIENLDNSTWCIKYLLEYHGTTTLYKFLSTKNLTDKKAISFMLQICKIIYLLYQGGYSHNDLHFNNLMIKKTSKKYFTFMNKNIPYCGYQISAIDFGKVLHKKFNIKHNDSYLQLFSLYKSYS
jgi:serine/threonine protein kinase